MSRNAWTDEEMSALDEDGIQAGLSWAEIYANLPGREPKAVYKRAVKFGLVRKMTGAWPQIPDRDEERDDPLLLRLGKLHRPATSEMDVPAGRAVRSYARPAVAMSLIGSAAAMAAGL